MDQFVYKLKKAFMKLSLKKYEKWKENTTPKISDENDDDELHVTGLKDDSLQHLVGYEHYLNSRQILDPFPPPAPGSIFLLFLQYLSLTETTCYEEIV